ncbi:MAG: glycerol-3-phosphate 1-O-acyltransferase PlsY [Candidatus Muirbacterium halophilum]|nr:glycerol-3-phosphate 1-O-acyltransferase PlsY [Candidatus Muirbacterium halophilum]
MSFFFINIVLSYFIGAIPFAYIIFRFFGKGDIRKVGSGNSGATNVTRLLGIKFGVLVFLLDFFKGYFGVVISEKFLKNYNMPYPIVFFYISIAFILIGHIYSVFLKFKGGKGAASGIGIIFALSLYSGISVFILWGIIFYFSKIVALSTIIASMSLPFFILYFEKTQHLLVFSILASLFVVFKHKSNIIRMIRKEENSFRR